jgi:peptidoglycan/LPS O-acetylase OafA/YrhL
MKQRFDRGSELMIDAVRGIAALLVLVTHSVDIAVSDVFGWSYDDNPEKWRWMRAVMGHGGYWVWCFFVISGLCIHRSIARSVAEGTFQWRRYLLARIMRIYPLFLLGLALAIVPWLLHADAGSSPEINPWPQFLASLLSLHIFTTSFPAFETSWSLSCEMMYYLAWPLILLAVHGRVRRSLLVAVAGVVLVLAGIFISWRVLHRFERSTAVDGLWIVTALFPVWIAGAWLAHHWETVTQRVTRPLWLASLALCALAEALLAILKYHQAPSSIIHLASWSSVPGLVIILAGARHAHLERYPWSRPVCEWLGRFSYPCYVLHLQLLFTLSWLLTPWLPESVASDPLKKAPLLLLPVLAFLALVGPRLELRAMRWRARVLARPARSLKAVVTA